MMPSPVEAPAHESLAAFLTAYAEKLTDLLGEVRWAFWRREFWNTGRWARADPELRKVLQRLYGVVDELLRLYRVDAAAPGGADWGGLSPTTQERVRELLKADPADLRLESALEVFDALDRLLVEVGDARYICAEVQGEILTGQRGTTWLTWKDLFGEQEPAALAAYHAGARPQPEHLDAARNMLSTLRRARSDDYQWHRARQRMRARNLRTLSALLVPVVVAFGWLIVKEGDLPASEVALIGVAGALGAIVAGTFKARDRLVRGSDLRAFRSGVVAQVLLGAASGLFLLVVLLSGIVEITGTDGPAGRAVMAFAAGFSEPLLIRTVEKVARLGADDAEAKPAA